MVVFFRGDFLIKIKSQSDEIKGQSGEIMLESTIVLTITIMMLIWVLGLGFLYYQGYLVTTATNDAAVKIANTYSNPTSDIVMGYVDVDDFCERDLYRGKKSESLLMVNQSKAEKYIKYQLEKTNFANTVNDVEVEVKLVADSKYRSHIEVTSVCNFNTPFGFALDFFGMDSLMNYTATSCCECVNFTDYINSVDYTDYCRGLVDKSSVGGLLNSAVKLIDKLVALFNHSYG